MGKPQGQRHFLTRRVRQPAHEDDALDVYSVYASSARRTDYTYDAGGNVIEHRSVKQYECAPMGLRERLLTLLPCSFNSKGTYFA